MIRAILFDFDGVICESVSVKVEAFRQLFAEYPQHIDRILKYHIDNGGLSRFVKFEYIFREILKKELTEQESIELGQRFTQIAFERVVQAPFVKGAEHFLEKYHQDISLFIVSGTPETEMRTIAKARNLDRYFRGIFGSPTSKADICRQILRDNRLENAHAIFLGDSINDYEGAKDAGIKFIGRVHKDYENPFSVLDSVKTVHDISEFEELICGEKLIQL